MRRAVLAALLVLLLPAAPAAACSGGSGADGPPTLAQRLHRAGGAFVGTLVRRESTRLTFRVQTRVKGRMGRRVHVQVPRLSWCGPAVRRGRRTGMLLERRGRHWEADMFAAVDPGELLKAAGIGP